MRGSGSERLVAVMAAIMLLLLAGLGSFQYRWLGEVAEAQEESMRRNMEIAADRIAQDFDLEISRAFFSFLHADRSGRLSRAARVSRGLRFYRATAFEPDLVSAVYVVSGDAPVLCFDEQSGNLVEAALPGRLAVEMPHAFERISSRHPGGNPLGQMPFLEDPPTLIVPQRPVPARRRPPMGRSPTAMDGPHDLVLVTLDPGVLAERLLPGLVATHLGAASEDLVVALFGSEPGSRTIYSNASSAVRRGQHWEVVRPVWIVHPFPGLRLELSGEEVRDEDEERSTGLGAEAVYDWRVHSGRAGPWLLGLANADGSLEEAVERTRALNLLLAFGTLVLIGVTTVLLLRSVRQAALLARKQVDFVAGVTHELHTPLTAITSAADNLADGLVSESEHVRRYGELIRGEGRRLATMIGQVLDFAGIGRTARAQRVELDADEVVREALEDRRWAIEKAGVAVERSNAPDLPRALGDPRSLRRALSNLVDNALKYGGGGGWLGVEIDLESPERLRIRVRDRGPGVGREDAAKIFEPFHRGREVTASHVHGSGLGLAVARDLVESTGGELRLEEGRDQGASFAVLLPVAGGSSP